MDDFSLAGKTALITGGTRGVGRAIARQFARAGARVLANYVRDAASAESLKAEAATAGWNLELCRADLTSEKGLERLLEYAGQQFDSLHALVHCAATGVHRPIAELTARHFDWTFGLNVRAFLELVTRLLPRFAANASIVAVSSEGAIRAVPSYALVGASKAALESLARHMAVELAPRNIRVNVLSPGTVLTDAWKALPDSERRLAAAAEQAPRGRLTTLEEVAKAAQFLCSDAANGIIGHTLVVDGGFRIRE